MVDLMQVMGYDGLIHEMEDGRGIEPGGRQIRGSTSACLALVETGCNILGLVLKFSRVLCIRKNRSE